MLYFETVIFLSVLTQNGKKRTIQNAVKLYLGSTLKR